VKAGLVAKPEDRPWAAARAPLCAQEDGVTTISPLLGRIPDVAAYLPDAIDPTTADAFERALERAQSVGRPPRRRRLAAPA
jgi:hypothetical protein